MKEKSFFKKIAFISIPVAVIVFGLKYCAYLLTGSVALYSDALESLVNVVSAAAVWWSIHISVRPADREHPFGHYKAEYFSAGLVSMLIISAAVMIFYTAITSIIENDYDFELNIGVFLNLLGMVINVILAFILWRYGKRYRSEALKADAKHILADVFTSISILLGLILVYFTNWNIIDPILSILVAVGILWEGWRVFYNSVKGLMDSALSLDEITKIREIIISNAQGALEAHDLKTRVAGRAIFIEFHLVVNADMTVHDSHEICNRIEEALLKAFPYGYILIHVEPEHEAKLPLGTLYIPFA